MNSRVYTSAVVLMTAVLFAGCGSRRAAGDAHSGADSSPSSVSTATPTESPTVSPSATQPRATATTAPDAATATYSGGPRVPAAPEDSLAYDALLFEAALPDGFKEVSDERIGRVHDGSVLSTGRGFIAGRLQIHVAMHNMYTVQLECGEFRSAALARDALYTGVNYSTSEFAASSGFTAQEIDIAPLGDRSAAISGTLEDDGFTTPLAEVWYTNDTVLCTVIGFALKGDPLPDVVAIAESAATTHDVSYSAPS
jgi:hypothetical protein